MARYTSRQTTVKFEDGTGPPTLFMVMGPGPGDLSIGEINAENTEHIRVLNRGVHDGFVLGDDMMQACSLTLSLKNESITDASIDRVTDFIRKTGAFASGVSLDSTIWCWKCSVTMTDGVVASTIVLPKCEGTVSFSEGKEGHTMSLSFNNYGAPDFSAV